MSKYFMGLDLGQAQDYTALTVLERVEHEPFDRSTTEYHIRHLDRFQLGTPYPSIVEAVGKLLQTPPLKGKTYLIVDATGIGAPVVDMFKSAGLSPVAITITGGDTINGNDYEGYRVPKRDLVGILQVLFQSGRLKVAAELPMAKVLIEELLNFKVKINIHTAHDSYEAWREGVHDDLVLAVALAAWYAEGRQTRRYAFG